MPYTAAHWGSYRIDRETGTLLPVEGDPQPSRIGKGWASASRDRDSRVMKPAIRKGWLEGDGGAGRSGDRYVEVSWDEALRHCAGELTRVRETYGNGAIFGGSYGWSSAGRFHHAQSQMRRFLNLAGGFVGARETYSHAAAEVLFPHIMGLSNRAFQDEVTAMPSVSGACEIMLAFGGISPRTAQVASSGTSRHEVAPWLKNLANGKTRLISVSPRRGDLEKAEWWAIRPGTDTALILALCQEIIATGRANEDFLKRCTSGYDTFRDYLAGKTDGTAKSAEWAADICDIPADTIRETALELTEKRSLISMTWSMQRGDHGEQPIWAGLALAAIIGQIGLPGGGYAFGYGCTTPVGRPTRLIPWPSLPQGINPVSDFIPVARIADMLLNPGSEYPYNGGTRSYPDIRLVWWTGGNPFHHHQDLYRLEKAWQRPETVIVNEHSWTATARRADIVLPATTPLERDDIMMNRRDPALIYMSALDEPMGEALDDHDIFARLAERMGFGEAFTKGKSSAEWLEHLWERAGKVAEAHGFALPDFETFKAEGRFDIPDEEEVRIALSAFAADPEGSPLATESGRITLFNEKIAAMGLADCPGHPTWMPPVEWLGAAEDGMLQLISGQPDTRLHSQNDRGSESLSDKVHGREAAYLHPETARANGLAEGDIICLSNQRGACLAGLRFDDGLRPDCVFLPTGAWYDPQIVDGVLLEVHGNPNALTIDKGCSGLSQGNIAHTCLVRVEKWDRPLPALSIDRPPIA
ncbi:molybdopterin-dependent oxidoreductase [Martelella lutilitoris]|uniref:Molybdopterin-dependent oxidoreductase n=1 Tax=Martelella lutilitoris TaxID=2583532 RepID=A0A7T7HJ48_9HYPH|nr:molybdopterin-dependent oxidoreductase [Martelella lutilitoris]QQM30082.1 molybdopterin-dependent oxidoreductase [Martelella lutilitoris]